MGAKFKPGDITISRDGRLVMIAGACRRSLLGDDIIVYAIDIQSGACRSTRIPVNGLTYRSWEAAYSQGSIADTRQKAWRDGPMATRRKEAGHYEGTPMGYEFAVFRQVVEGKQGGRSQSGWGGWVRAPGKDDYRRFEALDTREEALGTVVRIANQWLHDSSVLASPHGVKRY